MIAFNFVFIIPRLNKTTFHLPRDCKLFLALCDKAFSFTGWRALFMTQQAGRVKIKQAQYEEGFPRRIRRRFSARMPICGRGRMVSAAPWQCVGWGRGSITRRLYREVGRRCRLESWRAVQSIIRLAKSSRKTAVSIFQTSPKASNKKKPRQNRGFPVCPLSLTVKFHQCGPLPRGRIRRSG